MLLKVEYPAVNCCLYAAVVKGMERQEVGWARKWYRRERAWCESCY